MWQEELKDSRSQNQDRTTKPDIFASYSWIRRTIPSVRTLFNSPVTHFCLTAFFFKRVAFTSENFMFQYVLKKFGWELRRTTWLRMTFASGAVFTILAVCPLLAFVLTNRGYIAHKLDMNVIRTFLVYSDDIFPSQLGLPVQACYSFLGMALLLSFFQIVFDQ